LSVKNLPKAVLTSFQKSYPNALIKGAATEKENGKTYYEIERPDGSQRRDLLYTKEGKVAEIEENLASNEIPDFVKNSVMKKYPNCGINKSEKVMSNKNISYEIVIGQGDQENEIVLDSKGNIQRVENMKKEHEVKENDDD
jgi:hypothetical protein